MSKRVSFLLNDDCMRDLRDMAKEEGLKTFELVRHWVWLFINNHRQLKAFEQAVHEQSLEVERRQQSHMGHDPVRMADGSYPCKLGGTLFVEGPRVGGMYLLTYISPPGSKFPPTHFVAMAAERDKMIRGTVHAETVDEAMPYGLIYHQDQCKQVG